MWEIQCDQSMSQYFGQEQFNNAGLLRKSAGTNTTTLGLAFVNGGTVDAESGTILFSSGSSLGGNYQAEANGAVYFYGSCTIVAALNFQGPGPVQITGGSVAGTLSGMLNWSGGQINSWAPLEVASNGVLNIVGDVSLYGPLTNYGTVNWQAGTVQLINNNSQPYSGTIWNQTGALWEIQCDQSMSQYFGQEQFNNAGLLRKSAGTNTAFNTFLQNGGIVNVQNGILNLNRGCSLTSGTLNVAINSLNNFGQINVGGSAALAGTFGAYFTGGYLPVAGNSFPVVTYASETGIFANLNLPKGPPCQISYGATAFTLSIANTPAMLGLPSTSLWNSNGFNLTLQASPGSELHHPGFNQSYQLGDHHKLH